MKKYIAITGGIGSGKSTVLAYLQTKGYPVFSCDEIYREVIALPIYIEEIGKAFPEAVKHGSIDKRTLGQIVFSDDEKRALLNQIAHPMIMRRLRERMEACTDELVFAEVPLLFEGNYENTFDGVLVVIRKKEARVRSLIERDGSSIVEIENKMASQFDYYSAETKKRFAACNAILLENDADKKELKRKMDILLQKL